MQTCVGCRGYSDLLLKVSGGRIISSYLLPLSKPLSAHLAPSFPLLSLLWKLNHVSNAARAAKARCRGRDGDGGTGGARRKAAFCSWAIPELPRIPTSSFPRDFMETLTHFHPDCTCAWPRGAQYCLEHGFCMRGAWRAGGSPRAPHTIAYSKSHPPSSSLTRVLIQALLGPWCR